MRGEWLSLLTFLKTGFLQIGKNNFQNLHLAEESGKRPINIVILSIDQFSLIPLG